LPSGPFWVGIGQTSMSSNTFLNWLLTWVMHT
jgi:hypothetical protein